MVSFPVFSLTENQHLDLYAVTGGGELTRLWTRTHPAPKIIPAELVNASVFVQLVSEGEFPGFKMRFSFHSVSNYPQRNGDGLFNCSSPDYASFRHHLDCNFLVECLGLEDAWDCPEFEPESQKVYKIFPRVRGDIMTWYHCRERCRRLGGDLATMKTLAEWNKFYQLAGNVSRVVGNVVWVGIHSFDLNVADYYRHAYFWVDNIVSYSVNVTHLFFQTVQGRVCLFHSPGLCDFREDCDDASDEAWCVHSEQCAGFTCRNGQCVAETAHCDVRRDCWDGSDEVCDPIQLLEMTTVRMLPPTLISFDGQGNFSQTPLSPSDTCPETHLRCSDGNCLPVFVRCNGVYDCSDKADEAQCDNVRCPGFYRCRSSSVCVHPDHLCDGWPQCPQRDDEWLCQAMCPSHCSCHGHAFVCPRHFPAPAFPQLRYLDASRSGMTMDDVSTNVYLTWLRLASCGIMELPVMDLPNLRLLDLSDNRLTSLRMDVFLSLTNLVVLSLAGNPLLSVTAGNNFTQQRTLQVFDISNTFLTSFGSQSCSGFPELRILNASFSQLEVITEDGFLHTPKLSTVDLQGNPVERFPVKLFTGLSRLEAVYSDNYKMCCRDTLPANFETDSCYAPRDEISSCEDLLRSDIYRAFLWMFCILACLGNAGCLLFRSFVQKTSLSSGFNVFVSSLGAADFLMGIYLAMVGGADIAYRGQYFLFETAWKAEVVCKAAGFLSLLSCETSATMICVITLDRFLVLRFPFSRFHFKPKSAVLTCVAVWLLGVIIAAVPLLPVTSQWQFYGQTGICIPLPITRQSFPGQGYAFAVMIVFNLVLFLLIAAGQLLIFWTIRATAITSTARYKSKEMTIARRLTSIVVSDFLCWFPIGLLGVLAATGTQIPGEVNVAVAILVLPLNSALNPFLYTFNLLVERWDKQEEQRLLKALEEERDQD
ncbi:G-protein coupled receptor GRL101-like [Littorina saxatilis]|uniref:G-protein coupled receptor GRL101-like n=1 Tax=Littorina saxatilis TaxID=31220 RepID=UPI0038B69E39